MYLVKHMPHVACFLSVFSRFLSFLGGSWISTPGGKCDARDGGHLEANLEANVPHLGAHLDFHTWRILLSDPHVDARDGAGAHTKTQSTLQGAKPV